MVSSVFFFRSFLVLDLITLIHRCQSAVVPFRDLPQVDILYNIHGDDEFSANAADAPQIGNKIEVVKEVGEPSRP